MILAEIDQQLQKSIKLIGSNILKPDANTIGVFDVPIYEYELQYPNYTFCSALKLLPEVELLRLSQVLPDTREHEIELLDYKYNVLGKVKNYVRRVKIKLATENNIAPDNIFAVTYNRVFITRAPLINLDVGLGISFKKMNTYTVFLRTCLGDFLYKNDSATGANISIMCDNTQAGITESNVLLKDVARLVNTATTASSGTFHRELTSYNQSYIDLERPTETYRCLDTNMFDMGFANVTNITQSNLHNANIVYNYTMFILAIEAILVDHVASKRVTLKTSKR